MKDYWRQEFCGSRIHETFDDNVKESNMSRNRIIALYIFTSVIPFHVNVCIVIEMVSFLDFLYRLVQIMQCVVAFVQPTKSSLPCLTKEHNNLYIYVVYRLSIVL